MPDADFLLDVCGDAFFEGDDFADFADDDFEDADFAAEGLAAAEDLVGEDFFAAAVFFAVADFPATLDVLDEPPFEAVFEELDLDAELVFEPEPDFNAELVLDAELGFELELDFDEEDFFEPVDALADLAGEFFCPRTGVDPRPTLLATADTVP